MIKRLLLFAITSILFIVGCEKKIEPVPVGEMTSYKDPGYGFTIQYPANWVQLGTVGNAVFTKSQDVVNKFMDPTTGEAGAMVTVKVLEYTGGRKAADLMDSAKSDLKQMTAELQTDVPITVAGKQATKVPYSIRMTTKTNATGYEIFIPGDTAMYTLDFRGYGDYFGAHQAVFDAMLNSFTLPVIVLKKPDYWVPSATNGTYNSDYFTMDYPDNMNFAQVSKGDKDLAMELRADRLDCSIHIDVFGAKKLTVDKVWEQNKAKYKAKSTGDAKIGGEAAHWVDYTPAKDIVSRAYFTVHNDKVIRITLNWFGPQHDIYFTPFEKSVNSIKFK
ncbi:MAG TPA: PsbP-related protein [Bacteroidota bacterium]|nr:PsbP-related protein [Bacteroidota bacterium]